MGFGAVTILYGLTMEFLGFYSATFLYALLFIIWMKGASALKAVVISFAAVGIIYFIFHYLMFVPFPRGEILDLLGF